MNNQAILITGGAGYIGSQTVRSLIEAGFDPVVLDNLSTGFKSSLPNVPFYEGDIQDSELLRKIFKQHSIKGIIHLAAKMVGEESFVDPLGYYDTNITGLLTLVRVCNEFAMKKIIFSSSGGVYGDIALQKKNGEKIFESDGVSPISPYGLSKLFGEKILSDARNAYGIQSISLRYFNVAGADVNGINGQRRVKATHIIHVASLAALSAKKEITIYGDDYQTFDGTCVRDYIHVADIADIQVQALKYLFAHDNESHILNCGYGVGYSVKQVLETFTKVNQVELKIKYGPRRLGDPASLICDGAKLANLLQWKPKYADFGTICSTAYQWQKKFSQSS